MVKRLIWFTVVLNHDQVEASITVAGHPSLPTHSTSQIVPHPMQLIDINME
jgi:hypothetical protein